MLDYNIITFHRSINYGATLQTFALQEFISQLGYSVGVYDYIKPKPNGIRKTARARVNNMLGKIVQDNDSKAKQMKRYSEFVEEHLALNHETASRIFLTGSDQVWNLNNSMDSMFFLQFLDDSVFKASYAASMSKSTIPDERKSLVTKYLSTFDSISVRESGIRDSLGLLTSKDISVNIDPTLLHDKEFYSGISAPIAGIPERFVLAYILHIPKNGNKLLRWLQKETGLPIVLLDSTGNVGVVVKHNLVIRDAGPKEFVYLFEKADCVVTTSFHGTCFSLVFEKEFYAIVNPYSPGRISNLLSKFSIQEIKESDNVFTRRDNIDWTHVRKILFQERQESRNYIHSLFEASKRKVTSKPSGDVRLMSNNCTGCGACEAICPANAIAMILNERGFFEPSVNENKCIHCNKCVRACPVNNKYVVWSKKAYYGWNTSSEVLFASSSGGAFSSIADVVLKKKGVVFGAMYSDDWKDVIFECTEDVSLQRFRKSKYTVSSPEGLYGKIRRYLDTGRLVMFSGTPCQCAGVKSVFGDQYNNLITCDFVCGGMPSLSFYREHINKLQTQYGSRISSVDFRPKKWGWGRYRLFVQFENGKKYVKRDFADAYFKAFVTKASVRHICESCPFYHFHRSDFTIADFWGFRSCGVKKHREGMSMVVCNTTCAVKLFDEVRDFETYELPIESIHYTIRDKIPNKKKIDERDRFFSLSKQKGFENAALEMYDLNELHHYINKAKTKLQLGRFRK